MVPWPNESKVTQSTERVNKAFVKGLRARIALYAAGYSQRADGVRRSTNPELSVDKMYTIVKNECEDVIKNSGCELRLIQRKFHQINAKTTLQPVVNPFGKFHLQVDEAECYIHLE